MPSQQKRIASFLFVLIVYLAANLEVSGQLPVRPVHVFSLDSLVAQNENCAFSHPVGNTKTVVFIPPRDYSRLILPGYNEGIPFDQAKYLVIEVSHQNPAATVVMLEFRRIGDQVDDKDWIHARINCRIGILPGLPTQIVFPLDYLDAQHIFLPKYPRQLKGTLGGNRMSVKEIDEIYLRIQHAHAQDFPLSVNIHSISLTSDLPSQKSEFQTTLIDSLGQWTGKNWPGKVASLSGLEQALNKSHRQWGQEENPRKRSDYMGYTNLRFDSTGFFHIHHDGKRWWLVDPQGYAYLSHAPTGIGPKSHGPVGNARELFSFLPDNSGVFTKAYGFQNNVTTFSFLTANLMSLYGDRWGEAWLSSTKDLLKGLGYAGSGNWSDPFFYTQSDMSYVYPMRGFPSTTVKIFRDFPDVFDPKFTISCQQYAQQLEKLKDDPWMVGYFLGNEPHWAFGDYNLAREMLYRNQYSHSRRAFMDWIRDKYKNNPFRFSAVWEIEIQSFADLDGLVFRQEKAMSPGAEADLKAFTALLVDRYAAEICTAVKAADPNHLNLGLRFAWISSAACLQTGKYFDVFSLNGYNYPDPPETAEIAAALNKPVMIGEFHFGSIDRGLPATGIRGVASQKDRGIAYQRYVEQGFARPEVIGIHYFQWNDQPFTGRFDGENYNIGIVDVTNRPYPELARHIRRTNNRLFRVANDQLRPYSRLAETMPNIYY